MDSHSIYGPSSDSLVLFKRGPPEQGLMSSNIKSHRHPNHFRENQPFLETRPAAQSDDSRTDTNPRKQLSDAASSFVGSPPKSPYLSLLIMYAFYLAGLAFAIGHHYYYASRDRKPATDQTLILRYGTLLTFLSKANLVWAIGVALKQRSWVSLRQKNMTLHGVDSLFAMADDMTAMLSWELVKNAKLAVLLATFCWIGPIAVILASQALSVEPTVDAGYCPGATTLNFSLEALEQWRDPTKVGNFFAQSLNLFNKTAIEGGEYPVIDYWTSPSQTLIRASEVSFISRGVFPPKDGGNMACGQGLNCNYVVHFEAPGYKCETASESVGSKVAEFDGERAPFNIAGYLLPEGSNSYYTHATRGDYAQPQFPDTWPGGVLKPQGTAPPNLGAFRTEPIIWMGYSAISDDLDPDSPVPENRDVPGWDTAFVPNIIACKMHNMHYEVEFDYLQGVQRTRVLQRQDQGLVINTTWTPEIAEDGTNDNTTAIPVEDYIHAEDISSEGPSNYRRTAAYHSMGMLFREFLNGTIDSTSVGIPIANTKVLSATSLVDPKRHWLPDSDMKDQVELLFEDFLLSLFAFPEMLVVTWAGQPDTWNGGLDAAPQNITYPCTISKPELRFTYQPLDLWLVYGIALVLSGTSVVVGTLSALQNGGVLSDTRYSTIYKLLKHCGIRFPELGG